MAKIKRKDIEQEGKVKKLPFKKRVKRFYKNNRIYCILMGISLVCILLVVLFLVTYFIAQTNTNPYGNRLEGISDYSTKKDFKTVKEYLKSVKGYVSADVRTQGKIIYLDIEVDPSLTLEDMQNIAVGSLESFSTENLGYYDLQFAISRKGYVTYYGSKSSTNSTITWSNYNLDDDGDTNE